MRYAIVWCQSQPIWCYGNLTQRSMNNGSSLSLGSQLIERSSNTKSQKPLLWSRVCNFGNESFQNSEILWWLAASLSIGQSQTILVVARLEWFRQTCGCLQEIIDGHGPSWGVSQKKEEKQTTQKIHLNDTLSKQSFTLTSCYYYLKGKVHKQRGHSVYMNTQ